MTHGKVCIISARVLSKEKATSTPDDSVMRYQYWKRIFDLIGASMMLAAALPLLGLTALALWLVEGMPVLFRQPRIGRHGTPFILLKFRTMLHGLPPHLPDRPVAKAPHDPRVTPLGRLLRRLAIDELPQLLNVLRGEMSLVGPRPLPQEDLQQSGWLTGVDAAERARRQQWAERRHQVLPGLTGLWQISRKSEMDFENWIACDLAYVAQRSLWLDLRIVLATPLAVLRGREQSATAHQHQDMPPGADYADHRPHPAPTFTESGYGNDAG